MTVESANVNAILRHESTRLFVSHGGLNSILESMIAAVPLIIIP